MLKKNSKENIIRIKSIIIGLLFLLGCNLPNQKKVCFKNDCFYVKLATTPLEREQGLMFKRHLDYNEGMLFLFEDEQRHSFWMKNTFIALDIIWLDKNKEIVFIKPDALPCKENSCPQIQPDRKAKYVLELNAGAARKIGLKVGDEINF